ncbi:MAG: hypothetical protein DMF06_14215 [Verrucomicrobia bacterium]|nr:MAG: hypothetical protein DMF06_14215 [Verrucomicrobiota bacterium]
MMNNPRDLIRAILLRVRERDDQFTEQMALQVEEEIRLEWAGERVYIGRRKADSARAAYKQGASAKELQKRFGFSRSWAFRLTQVEED